MSFLFEGIVCWIVERFSMKAAALGEVFMDPPPSMLNPPMKLLLHTSQLPTCFAVVATFS
jgi:hypothetical protein